MQYSENSGPIYVNSGAPVVDNFAVPVPEAVSPFAVPNYNFDLSAFQNIDLSADAINSRISPELLQSAEARHHPQELARSKAMYQSYLNKANGDQVLANQLRAQDIIASNNARGVDPASTEREVWSILNGDKDFATDPSSPYKVKGRDLNWGIVAAMLAPAFAAQFGLLGGGAGAASGAGGAATSGGLGELIAANNAYMSTFAPGALAGGAGTGTLLGSAGADTLGGAAAVNAGNFAITPAITAANAAALGSAATGATTVAELVVTAAQAGMTIPQIAAAVGIPLATTAAIVSGSGVGGVTQPSGANAPEDFVSDELVVQAPATSPANPFAVVPPVVAGTALGSGVPTSSPGTGPVDATVDELVVEAAKPPVVNPLAVVPPVVAGAALGSGVPTSSPGTGPVDATVDELVVEAPKTPPVDPLAVVLPAAAAGTAAGPGAGPVDATVDELVVEAPKTPPTQTTPVNPLEVLPLVLPSTLPSVPTNVPDLTPTNTGNLGVDIPPVVTPAPEPQVIIPPVLPSTAPQVPTNVPDLKPTDTSVGPTPSILTQLTDWLKAHPAEALSLLGGVAGAAGSASGSGSGGTGNKYGLQNPMFKASLPKAQNFAVRAPRNVQTDWANYGAGPEASFFTNVPDLYPRSAQPSQFAVNPTPAIDRFPVSQGYKKGGYAVMGPGTGRSDSIDAKLSDGEYVIDAETVALLGDGSSKAGADQLDKFRVNIRKHKGRALSKGKFSTNAKAPEAYLAGGRP